MTDWNVGKLTLYGQPDWGSVFVEAQLTWYGIPFEFIEVGDLFNDEKARSQLAAINPLAQLPTLVLPDGSVMTESAAITLWLADETGSADLVPGPGDPERSRFLRWLVFFVCNIYPTYTYADDPARFVPDEAARSGFAERVTRYAEKLYSILDDQASSPWFLGNRFSALDIYICGTSNWRPGRAWFESNTPNLVAIANAARALPRLTDVWRRNQSNDQ